MDPFPLPSPLVMLLRGLVRRCPRCGGGRLFCRWLAMRPVCPKCGLRFEREEGYFLGAYVINFGAMMISLAVYIGVGVAVTLPDPSAVKLTAGAMVVATIVPIAFYPSSKALWSAFDLWMKPLEPSEVDAAREARPPEPSAPSGG